MSTVAEHSLGSACSKTRPQPILPPDTWWPLLRDCVEHWVVFEGRTYVQVRQLARLSSSLYCEPRPLQSEVDARVTEWAVDLWIDLLRSWRRP